MEQEASIFQNLFVIVMFFSYGIYLIMTGIQILWKGKKVLNIVHYIKMFFMKLLGNKKRADKYEMMMIESINWPTHGIFVLFLGGAMAITSIFLIFSIS